MAPTRKRMPEDLKPPKKCRLHDPDPGRFTGMPLRAGHTLVQIVTYRTPYAKED